MNEEPKENKNLDEQGGTLSPLGEIELEACRLRFEGFTYEEMMKQLVGKFGERAPAVQTLRHWFMRGGKLYVFYDGYVEEEAAARRKQSIDVFKSYLKEAARSMVYLMKTSPSDMVKFLSAKEIINRQLGEPVRPVANLNVKNPAREILEDAGLIEKGNDTGEAGEGS